ncbi:MAG: alcohol dehydrogenase catalytic domain-containing protein [Thermoanaerobaculia bacterium]
MVPSPPMRALVCERAGEVALREVPEPTPADGEVIVRVAAALTCGTDLKMIRRGHPKIPFPVILGHEFSGVVSRVGPGAPFQPGDRVASAVSGPCGGCPDCESGRENLCPTAFDRPAWGAFADLVRVPERVVARGLKLIPASLSFAAAALLDPLACVVRGLSRIALTPASNLLIYGSGPIALLFTLMARHAGAARIFVAGRRPGRLACFRAAGAETIDVSQTSVRAALLEATAARGPDVIIDTTGDAGIAADVIELVARGGVVLLFAGGPRASRLSVDTARIHYDEVSLIGSFHYTPSDARQALDLLVAGTVPVDALVTAERPLEEFADVFESLKRGEGMKTAFVP